MAKLFLLFCSIFFISYCNCTMCDDVTSPNDANSCKGLQISEGYTHCCYLRRKYHSSYGNGENFRTCVQGVGLEWIKMMDDMKELKISLGFIIDEWDCQCFENSNYLIISILSIILLFLLL